MRLPSKPLRNSHFAKAGRPDVVMIDAFPISSGDVLRLTFESAITTPKQGVFLLGDGPLTVNGQSSPGISLWYDSAPREVLIQCPPQGGVLHVYNTWDSGQGQRSQSYTSGMLIEEIAGGRRYRCNHIGLEPTFDSLVFSITRE